MQFFNGDEHYVCNTVFSETRIEKQELEYSQQLRTLAYIIHLFFFFIQSACADVKCTKKFTRCYESFNGTEDATCDCLPAYVSINNKCISSPNIVEVLAFKLNVSYVTQYSSTTNLVTKNFTAPLEAALHQTLNLKNNEYVKILRLFRGSVFVDFIILLKNDSQENRTTVYEKLFTEVKTNATGNLMEYFPVAEQVVVVVGNID